MNYYRIFHGFNNWTGEYGWSLVLEDFSLGSYEPKEIVYELTYRCGKEKYTETHYKFYIDDKGSITTICGSIYYAYNEHLQNYGDFVHSFFKWLEDHIESKEFKQKRISLMNEEIKYLTECIELLKETKKKEDLPF